MTGLKVTKEFKLFFVYSDKEIYPKGNPQGSQGQFLSINGALISASKLLFNHNAHVIFSHISQATSFRNFENDFTTAIIDFNKQLYFDILRLVQVLIKLIHFCTLGLQTTVNPPCFHKNTNSFEQYTDSKVPITPQSQRILL